MTGDVRALKPFATRQASKNREQILYAIRILGNPQPHEIKNYLDRKVNEIKEDRGYVLDYNQIKPFEQKITLRTIHRWLRALSKEGLINHIDNRYSLSDADDIRWSGQYFSFLVAIDLLKISDNLSVNASVNELVIRYGVLLIYLFIEAARPTKPSGMTTAQKRNLIISWVENSLPTRLMFFDFVSLFDSEKNTNQSVELNQGIIDKLTKALEKSYPKILQHIQSERKRYPKLLADWEKTKLAK